MMSVRKRIRRAHRDTPDLNITAFMNLMVVLVPFLLISAVFSHLAILELNLPNENRDQPQEQKKELNFEVVVRQDEMIVGDTLGGVIKAIAKVENEYDYRALSELLMQLKTRFPDKQNIAILLESDVPYDVLVQTMDTVRMVKVVEAAGVVQKELFPQISIGDAP
jgi:biopolymer transport protein ExbD